jgi:hypothetical protein
MPKKQNGCGSGPKTSSGSGSNRSPLTAVIGGADQLDPAEQPLITPAAIADTAGATARSYPHTYRRSGMSLGSGGVFWVSAIWCLRVLHDLDPRLLQGESILRKPTFTEGEHLP